MKIQYFVFLALPNIISCAGHPSPKNATTPVSLAPSAVQQADTTEAGGDSTAESCVFDTTTFKMTAAALKRFDPNLAYTWKKKDGTAVVPMKNKDTLLLRIGGCNHYVFLAEYRTDASRFNDETWYIDKVKWMAKNFFSDGFDTKYVDCITRRLYQRDTIPRPDTKWYYVQDPDTTVTDHVYDGFGIWKIGSRAEIAVSGYIN